MQEDSRHAKNVTFLLEINDRAGGLPKKQGKTRFKIGIGANF
jgi:hypothetical protein